MPKQSLSTLHRYNDAGFNAFHEEDRQPLGGAKTFNEESWAAVGFDRHASEHLHETRGFASLVQEIIDFCQKRLRSGGMLDKRFQNEVALSFPMLSRRLIAELMRGVANRKPGRPRKNVPN
jgi:hypothetical protein